MAHKGMVVAFTFTNAAADEMRTRIGSAGDECFIGTIHSYANRLLTRKGVDTGRLIQEGKFDMFFELLEENPNCIEEVEHLILDEAQDSDMPQFTFVLDRIKPTNFFIVGDPRQAIYSFRGARPDVLVDISNISFIKFGISFINSLVSFVNIGISVFISK